MALAILTTIATGIISLFANLILDVSTLKASVSGIQTGKEKDENRIYKALNKVEKRTERIEMLLMERL